MNRAKQARSIIPSKRLITGVPPVKKLNTSTVRSKDTPMHTGISKRMFSLLTAIGKNTAVRPRIPSTLNMFEPTTFPIATSALP